MIQGRAKIVCTIGSASSTRAVLFHLIKSGMAVARLNFSHGSHETQQEVVRLIREGSKKFKKPVYILQDLQGIKIRVGLFRNGEVELKNGGSLSIHPGEGTGDIVIITSSPLSTKTKTNFMKLHQIWE